MLLGTTEIRRRLDNGQLFRSGTWDPAQIHEASYALRVAPDGLIIDGDAYAPGREYTGEIEIKPGRVAVLSTRERFYMPPDVAGRLGIRFDFAARGLTSLMGIQVDPLYGRDEGEDRIFLRVANLSDASIRLPPGAAAFNIEFELVAGQPQRGPRTPTWTRLIRAVDNSKTGGSWTYMTTLQEGLESGLRDVNAELGREMSRVRENLLPVVMFGVFLVAITILAVVVGTIISLRETPSAQVPPWVTDWAWGLVLFTLSVAGIVTAGIGGIASIAMLRGLRSRSGEGNSVN